MLKLTSSFLILFLGSASGAQSLSLKDALQLSLKENLEIKSSQSMTEAAKADAESATGKYLPSIGLTAAYTHLDEDVVVDLSAMRTAMIGSSATAAAIASGNPNTGTAVRQALDAALPSFNMPIQKQDFIVASVNLTQPLFTGGKITANKKAKDQLYKGAQEEFAETQNRILANVVEQYFTAQMSSQVVKVRADALASLKEHQRIGNALLKQGQLAKAQNMKIEVAVADAELALSRSKRDEALAHRVLANTLEKESAEFNLTTPLQLKPLKPLDYYAQNAQSDNFNLKQLKIKKELLDAKKTAARSEFLPTLALIANYEIYEKDLTEVAPQWFAGLVFKMNIFNGMSDRSDLNTINQQKIALELMESHAHSMVGVGVQKYYSEILSAREQVETIQKTKALAQESLRLNMAAFKNGFAKSSDVMDSQVVLTATQLNELKALFDYNHNLAQLLKFSHHKNEILEVFNN